MRVGGLVLGAGCSIIVDLVPEVASGWVLEGVPLGGLIMSHLNYYSGLSLGVELHRYLILAASL